MAALSKNSKMICAIYAAIILHISHARNVIICREQEATHGFVCGRPPEPWQVSSL